MGLKCGLFPVPFRRAPGMALLEDTHGKRLALARVRLLATCRSKEEFFQDSSKATTLQKQRDCWLAVLGWFGRAGRP